MTCQWGEWLVRGGGDIWGEGVDMSVRKSEVTFPKGAGDILTCDKQGERVHQKSHCSKAMSALSLVPYFSVHH